MKSLIKTLIKKCPFFYKILNMTGNNRVWRRDKSNSIILNKSRLKKCNIRFNGLNNLLELGDYCNLQGVDMLFNGDNCRIFIGSRTCINASADQRTHINVQNGTSITIGEKCLFSNSIEIHSTDYHKVLDDKGTVINLDKNITIGKHVWIGFRCTLLKGTTLGDNCIVGANSLLNKTYEGSNCLIVGNPARVIKQGVNWME